MTPHPDTLSAVMVPMIQSIMHIRKHLPLYLPLSTTNQPHGAESKLPFSDKSMHQLLTTVQNGFPASKQDLPKDIQEYYRHRDDMYTTDCIILYKDCIVIPASLREDI